MAITLMPPVDSGHQLLTQHSPQAYTENFLASSRIFAHPEFMKQYNELLRLCFWPPGKSKFSVHFPLSSVFVLYQLVREIWEYAWLLNAVLRFPPRHFLCLRLGAGKVAKKIKQ